MISFRTIHETADLLGRERHVEIEMFRVLGAGSLGFESPEVMLYVANAARSHAWRAQLLEELLPVSLGLPGVDEATRSPGVLADQVIAGLIVEGDEDQILEALGKVVYPEMLSAYRHHLVSCSPASDLPVTIVLRRVIGDLETRLDELHEMSAIDDASLAPSTQAMSELLRQLGGPFGAIG